MLMNSPLSGLEGAQEAVLSWLCSIALPAGSLCKLWKEHDE